MSVTRTALLIGAGDIASRLSPLLQASGFYVTGARRRAVSDSSVFDATVQADIADSADCQRVLSDRPGVIVITLTPSEYSDAGYKQGYVRPAKVLAHVLADMDGYRPLVMFVSSTSVYGQSNGEWVDERSETLPQGFSGTRLLEAEKVLSDSIANCCIVRFSGIYGPGREALLTRIKQQTVKLTSGWTNRIHSDDCAGVLAHLIKCFSKGQGLESVYIGSDNMPVKQAELVQFLANEYGLNIDDAVVTDKVGSRGSKRLSNQRLRDSGYQFKVPSYQQGYKRRN